jgi:hypothetical protein
VKRSKFTDFQIMDAPKQVDAGLVALDFCRALVGVLVQQRFINGGLSMVVWISP